MDNARKTILFVSSRFGRPGGGTIVAIDYLRSLLSLDTNVIVLSSNSCVLSDQNNRVTRPLPEWVLSPELFLLEPEIDRAFPLRAVKWLKSAIAKSQFEKRIHQIHPDLIIVNELGSHRFLERFRDWDGVKRAVIIHNEPEAISGLFYKGSPEVVRRHGRELQTYDNYICASHRVFKHWTHYLNDTSKSWFYLSNTCDEDAVHNLFEKTRSQVRAQLQLPDDAFIIVCSASVQYRKGQDLLVKCIESLIDSIPNILICFVGDIEYAFGGAQLLKKLNTHPLRDRFLLVNRSESKHELIHMDYIYAADVFILPSRSECQPISIIESMALKTPVIASEVGGIPEMIEHGVSGLLFPPDNVDVLTSNIKEVAHNPHIALSYAREAEKKYWALHSRSSQVAQWSKILDVL